MGKEFHGEASNFPGAPKNFDPENPYADGVAMIQHREHIVREKMIKVETAKVRLPLSLDRPPPPPSARPERNPTSRSAIVADAPLRALPRPPQLLRERVQKCYQKEGVNHYENCKDEVHAYLESIKNVGVHRANAGPNDRSIA